VNPMKPSEDLVEKVQKEMEVCKIKKVEVSALSATANLGKRKNEEKNMNLRTS